jgi:hypothetical protein
VPNKLHDPIFVLDSRERFQPLAVDSIEAVEATMIDPNGSDGGRVGYRRRVEGGGLVSASPPPSTRPGARGCGGTSSAARGGR